MDFDAVLEEILESLPDDIVALLDEVPLIVEDEPTDDVLRELGIKPSRHRSDLCGLHTGQPIPQQRGVYDLPGAPAHIMIFRGPIMRLAGRSRKELTKQIRITVLHELGHHFGLDEERLHELGYG